MELSDINLSKKSKNYTYLENHDTSLMICR